MRHACARLAGILWTCLIALLWLGCWCWACLVDADNGGNAGPGG